MPMVKEALTTIPVWVQLFGVPLEYWTAEGMSYIGSAVGVPLFVDAPTEQGTRLKFARLCIEIDASKPLTEEIYIKPSSTEGKLIKIKAVYQWRPKQCMRCGVFGHTDQSCFQNEAIIPKQSSKSSDKASASDIVQSGKEPDSISIPPAPVWRIVSKKGKSRIAAEQEGILPTPNSPTTGLITTMQTAEPSTSIGKNVTLEEISEKGMASSLQAVTSNLKDLGQDTSRSSELEVTTVQENLNEAPPSEISISLNKQLLLSLEDFPPLSNLVSSTITHNLNSEGNQSTGKQKTDVPLSPGKSPSPACTSKLAARVKSIDGKIQITRQSSLALQGALPTDASQASMVEHEPLQISEARLGMKEIAQAAPGDVSLQDSTFPKGLMQGPSASDP